jgi:Flp pilus assembly protein TadD
MRYALYFALAILALTAGAVLTFNRISATSLAAAPALAPPPADTLPTREVTSPLAPTPADYARYADADRAWRDENARQYSARDLRERGDGRRTPREAMQDRVFGYTRRGDRARAIAELERWVRAHPRDQQSLLSLARLLNEVGRSDDAITRYRQILALKSATH